MSGACYIEIDPYCVAWLRNLIDWGVIADGVVWDTSVEDIRPVDLAGFTQVHAFAGIGVWSHALRLAGWGDERRVWTGSCPCQPFSSAGQGAGFGDERHLWPAWHHLISECRPPVVLGEQVAAKAANAWVDLVQDDMETLGYAFGAVPFPAAGVGAPHIRDRVYWVAYANAGGRAGECWRGQEGTAERGGALGLAHSSSTRLEGCDARALGHECPAAERGGCACGVGHAECLGAGRHTGAGAGEEGGSELWSVGDDARPSGAAGRLADDDDAGLSGIPGLRLQRPVVHDADGRGPLRGFWADAEWIPCRDGKWRPVEPGIFPLAHGTSARVGKLRAAGNAIVAQAAAEWIRTVMECMPRG